MPEWELAIFAEELPKFEARDTLALLDVATFSEWLGEMPTRPAKDDYDRQVQRAHEEGNRARKDYRERLHRQSLGLALLADNPDGHLNEYGEFVDARGVIHARNAAHIKTILSRKKTR